MSNIEPLTKKDLAITVEKEIRRFVPNDAIYNRLKESVFAEFRKNPSLQACNPLSIAECVGQASKLGLEIGGVLGHAYLIPMKNTCTLQVGYKGIIHLAYKSGIKNIQAQVVYQNDQFEIEYGLHPKLRHIPAMNNRGNKICVWAMAKLPNEDIPVFNHMSIEEVEMIRFRSKAKDSGPWNSDYDEMAKKTMLKRFFKILPSQNMDPLLLEAVEIDNQLYTADVQNKPIVANKQPITDDNQPLVENMQPEIDFTNDDQNTPQANKIISLLQEAN